MAQVSYSFTLLTTVYYYNKYLIDDDFSLCMLHEQGPPQKNFRSLTLRGQNEDEKKSTF